MHLLQLSNDSHWCATNTRLSLSLDFLPHVSSFASSGSVSVSLSDSILGFVLTSQGMIEFWMYVLDCQIQIRHFGSCVQYIGMDLNVLAK